METEKANDPGIMLEHVGGREKLEKFVKHFHHSLLEDPLLHEMFARAKPTHSAHLLDFLEEIMGGRKVFTELHNGVEGLFDAHANLAITNDQRQRFVDLWLKSAEAVGFPTDEHFRSALGARVQEGSMFSMKLSQPGVPPLPSPWPPVGTWKW